MHPGYNPRQTYGNVQIELTKLDIFNFVRERLNLTGSDLNFVDERLLVRRFELHVRPLGLDVALAEHDDRLPAVLHAAEDLRGDVLTHVPVAAVDTHLQSFRYLICVRQSTVDFCETRGITAYIY